MGYRPIHTFWYKHFENRSKTQCFYNFFKIRGVFWPFWRSSGAPLYIRTWANFFFIILDVFESKSAKNQKNIFSLDCPLNVLVSVAAPSAPSIECSSPSSVCFLFLPSGPFGPAPCLPGPAKRQQSSALAPISFLAPATNLSMSSR